MPAHASPTLAHLVVEGQPATSSKRSGSRRLTRRMWQGCPATSNEEWREDRRVRRDVLSSPVPLAVVEDELAAQVVRTGEIVGAAGPKVGVADMAGGVAAKRR